jgi:tetratricopeptide (TPR) repeat protein
MWQALAGEAVCHAGRVTKDDYKQAVRLQTLALELLENMRPGVATDDTLKRGRHDCLERLGSCHVALGDENKAVEAYESAFQGNNRCSFCINALLKLYREKQHHKGIIELLKSMDEHIEGHDYTRLSESLFTKANYDRTNSYFEIIAHAAAVGNETAFLYGIYESAIQVAQRQHKSLEATNLELCLAALYNRHGRPELAAKIWESIATTYHNINTLKAEYTLARVKFDAKISLARHCLKQAVEYGKDSKEAQEYGTKLKDLTKVRTGTEITIGGSAVARMLGSWYMFMGQDEKARQCFRVELMAGLRMLADDDPSNNVVAYANLAVS